MNQRNIAQLENQREENQQTGAIPRTNSTREPLYDDLSEEEMAIRPELGESDSRHHPSMNNPRRSIRLIRETSRVDAMKFNGNIAKCNPKKLVRDFEENATLEGLQGREKLSFFKTIMKGEAAN